MESMAERAAFEGWMGVHSRSLLRTAVLLAGDYQAGEDLLQSTLQKTYLRWPAIQDPDAGAAYARKVMVRLASRSWRRRWRAEVPTGDLPERSGMDGYASVDDRDRLRRELARLPRQQRTIVVLRYYEDRSESEVADLLGISVGTVKNRAHKGLARLREAMMPAVIDLAAPDTSSDRTFPLPAVEPQP